MSETEQKQLAKLTADIHNLLGDHGRLVELAKANGSINRNSKITLGLVVSLIGCSTWLAYEFANLKHEIKNGTRDRWTGKMMSVWTARASHALDAELPDTHEIQNTYWPQ